MKECAPISLRCSVNSKLVVFKINIMIHVKIKVKNGNTTCISIPNLTVFEMWVAWASAELSGIPIGRDAFADNKAKALLSVESIETIDFGGHREFNEAHHIQNRGIPEYFGDVPEDWYEQCYLNIQTQLDKDELGQIDDFGKFMDGQTEDWDDLKNQSEYIYMEAPLVYYLHWISNIYHRMVINKN